MQVLTRADPTQDVHMRNSIRGRTIFARIFQLKSQNFILAVVSGFPQLNKSEDKMIQPKMVIK